jgi:hypothetical protein
MGEEQRSRSTCRTCEDLHLAHTSAATSIPHARANNTCTRRTPTCSTVATFDARQR